VNNFCLILRRQAVRLSTQLYAMNRVCGHFTVADVPLQGPRRTAGTQPPTLNRSGARKSALAGPKRISN